MSLTTKDMVFGGATAAAFLGLIVYNEAKFKKMQGEIDRLNQETKVLAQYVKLLESQMASELHGGAHRHHQHQVGAANPSAIQGQEATPALPAQEPDQAHTAHQHNHGQHHSHHGSQHPHQHVHQNPNQRPHQHAPTPQPQQQLPPQQFLRRPAARPQEQTPHEDSDEGDESPENSNRRPSSSVPRNPAARSDRNPSSPAARPREPNQPARPTVEHSAARRVLHRPVPEPEEKHQAPRRTVSAAIGKDKEEAVGNSDRKIKDDGPNQDMDAPRSVRKTEEPKDPPKKRFMGKTDDADPTEKLVSSRRPKSSLKNAGAGTGDEVPMDEDLMNDIEAVAKSSGRGKAAKDDNQNEGRPDAESGRKAQASKTAQRAEAMRKQAEDRKAARAAKGGSN